MPELVAPSPLGALFGNGKMRSAAEAAPGGSFVASMGAGTTATRAQLPPLTAQPGACRPIDDSLDQRTNCLRSPSGRPEGDQTRSGLPRPLSRGFFSEHQAAAWRAGPVAGRRLRA